MLGLVQDNAVQERRSGRSCGYSWCLPDHCRTLCASQYYRYVGVLSVIHPVEK